MKKLVIIVALVISAILTFLLYFFVLVPLSSAEVSIAYTDESLQGQVGKVIVPIPIDGFGEIVIETVNGLISKRAAGYDNEEIEYEKEVLIIEVENGTFLVKEYEPLKITRGMDMGMEMYYRIRGCCICITCGSSSLYNEV